MYTFTHIHVYVCMRVFVQIWWVHTLCMWVNLGAWVSLVQLWVWRERVHLQVRGRVCACKALQSGYTRCSTICHAMHVHPRQLRRSFDQDRKINRLLKTLRFSSCLLPVAAELHLKHPARLEYCRSSPPTPNRPPTPLSVPRLPREAPATPLPGAFSPAWYRASYPNQCAGSPLLSSPLLRQVPPISDSRHSAAHADDNPACLLLLAGMRLLVERYISWNAVLFFICCEW